MRRILSLITTLLLASSLFTACGGGKKKGKGTIYGTWKYSGRNHYVFKKDGTFINRDVKNPELTEKGTFTLKAGIISIKGNPLMTRKFKVISIDSELVKVKWIRKGKVQTGHYRWERVE